MSAITEKDENFLRVCQLLMDQGVKVMRNEFDNIHPPQTMDNVLQIYKSKLKKLSKKELTDAMWSVLYPGVNRYGNSRDFDLKLLYVLFRNICNLNPPVVDAASEKRSWDEDPLQNDISLEADIVRLRLLRNRIYAHTTRVPMSSEDFDITWSDIAQVLIRRGRPPIQIKIDALRSTPFTKVEEFFSMQLQDWYLQDWDVKNELGSLSHNSDKSQDEVKSIGNTTSSHTGKLEDTYCEVMSVGDTVGTLTDSLTDAHHQVQGIGNALNTIASKLSDFLKNVADIAGTPFGKFSDMHDEVESTGNIVKQELEVKGIGQTVSTLTCKLSDAHPEVKDLGSEIIALTYRVDNDPDEIRRVRDKIETNDDKLDGNKNASDELRKLTGRQEDIKDDLHRASNLLKEQHKTELETLCFVNLKTKCGQSFKRVGRKESRVDLAMACNEEVDKEWLHSDREYHLANYSKEKQMLKYDDLITTTDKFLILRGIAGIGKTSLLDYLLLQWANGNIWNNDDSQPSFQFVFKFTCRELNLCQDKVSIKGLFERFYPNVFEQMSFEDLLQCRQGVLVVLDGFDEFCEQKETLQNLSALPSDQMSIGGVVHNILTNLTGFFSDLRIVIASRPESANILYSTLGKKLEIKRVDVLGFSRETVLKYVENFATGKPDIQKVILRKINESESLKAMCQIPVYLWIICSIFENNVDITSPQTNTELYIWAFTVFVREYLKASDNSSVNISNRPLTDMFFNEKCREVLRVLSHLSFEMMAKKRVLFYSKDIRKLNISVKHFPTEASGFIVHTMKNDVEGNVYQFRHLILQEFFSACYLVRKSEQLLQSVIGNDRFVNVIPIIAGLQGALLKNNKSSELVKCFAESLRLSTRIIPVINSIYSAKSNFYCLISSVFEFANPISKQSRNEIASQLKMCYVDFSIIYYHQLKYFIHFMKEMMFKSNCLVEHGEEGEGCRSGSRAHLQRIEVNHLQLNQDQLSSLLDVVFCTKSLTFRNTEISGTDGLEALSCSIASAYKVAGESITLQEVNIQKCSLNEKQFCSIARAIPYLQKVNILDSNLMGTAGFNTLAEEVISAKCQAEGKGKSFALTKLSVIRCDLNEDKLCLFAKAVPHVKEVDFSYSESMGTTGFKVLAEEIISTHNSVEKKPRGIALEKLSLSCCNLNNNELSACAKAVPYIQEVDLSCNRSIGTAELKVLAEAITGCQNHVGKDKRIVLKRLSLSGCDLNGDELSAFAKGIPFVQEVDLSNNESIDGPGFKVLADEIINAQKEAENKDTSIILKILSLLRCDLNENELSAFAKAIPHIQEVRLSYNESMGSAGLKELATEIVNAQVHLQSKGKNIALLKLLLYDCDINEDELRAFAKGIPYIQEVYMSGNKSMGTDGFKVLAKEVISTQNQAENNGRSIALKTLSLWGCNLNENELSEFSKVVPYIQEINLSGNKSMGAAGFNVLARDIIDAQKVAASKGKGIALKKLSLVGCNLDREELIAFAEGIPYVQEVNLAVNKSMGTDGFKVLAEEIVNAQLQVETKGKDIALKTISFSDCNLNQNELNAFVKGIPYIQEVDLSWNQSIGTAGFKLLAEEITSAKDRAESNGKYIALTKLSLCECDLNENEFRALTKCIPFIQEVNLSWNQSVGSTAFNVLSEEIIHTHARAKRKRESFALMKLSFSDCNLKDNELTAFAKCIPHIQDVNLSGNQSIGKVGFNMLAEAIVNSQNQAGNTGSIIALTKLSLCDCDLNAVKLKALVKAIPYIRKVDLSFNKSMGIAGLEMLAEEIITTKHQRESTDQSTALTYLSLFDCDLNENHLSAFAKGIPHIEVVDLFGNQSIGTTGFDVLVKEVTSAQHQEKSKGKAIALKKLFHSGCGVNEGHLTSLAKAVPQLTFELRRQFNTIN